MTKNKCEQGFDECTGNADRYTHDPFADEIHDVITEKTWWCDECHRAAIMET